MPNTIYSTYTLFIQSFHITFIFRIVDSAKNNKTNNQYYAYSMHTFLSLYIHYIYIKYFNLMLRIWS